MIVIRHGTIVTAQRSFAADLRIEGERIAEIGPDLAVPPGSTTIDASATFSCVAPVEAGQFTIPAYVLAATPVGSGGINLLNQSVPVPFPASGMQVTYAVAETESTITCEPTVCWVVVWLSDV